MKRVKRLFAFLLCFALILPLLPTFALGAEEEALTIDNGYIQVSVSKKNGGFLVNTVEGNLLRKSDNNKDLLYRSGAYDTSFVSFRVGTGAEAKDYLFGGRYPGSGAVSVTRSEGSEIVAVWSVDGITFTQTISMASDNAAEHGMVSVGLSAKNESGAPVPVQARILLDTCLGDQDWAHYQLNAGTVTATMDTEQIITDEAALRSFYAVDDIANPAITAYVISTPTRAAIGHWNNLAASLFDFAPDLALNFANPINEYLTADSACALYYDMGTVANGDSRSVVSYYGVYSNHTVKLQNSIAINTVAPMRLMLDETGTAYVRESSVGLADFAVTVNAENYKSDTSRDLTDLILAVRSTGGLCPLSDSGEEINGIGFDTTDPLTIPYSKILEGETVTKTLYFRAKSVSAASYERITVGMYRGEVTGDNLLGERNVYVLLPGSDGSIPKVCFNSMSPGTIYNAGTRHLYVTVTNALLLSDSLDAGSCVFRVYSDDGKNALTIPSDNITVNPADGVADIALTDDLKLAVGNWQLQLEWSDDAVANDIVRPEYRKQTADILRFGVSDNPKYKNDTYGVLAAVKYGKGTSQFPYYYRLVSFPDENRFKEFAEAKTHEWTEIPLVFRGAFTMDQRYVEKDGGKVTGGYYYSAVSKKVVDPQTRESKVDNPITINGCLDFEGGTIAIYYEEYADPGKAVSSPILCEFDGELYTSIARTSVWTGKAALTKLEQGKDFGLIHYTPDGSRKTTNSNPITLIWPNVFSVAQTLSGLAFKLAYGQFGVMENKDGEIGRVISFAASLSLSFLRSPEGDETDYGTASYFGRMQELWKDWRGASIYQYAYHGSRYEKLTNIGMNDKDKSGDKQQGVQTSVMIPDILFGCKKGFVGLNFTVDVTVKNMVDSLAKIEAAISVNTINNWSFGLAGQCELVDDIKMEAKLSFKSYNNIPIPDELYFYAGGFKPGLCIDPCGVVWITGAGGGFSGLYDTIIYTGGVPPLKLIMTMGFAAIQILEGTARMEVSGTGVSITASDLKFKGNIEVIKKISVAFQWYPDIKLSGAIYVSMFEKCIEGQGYVVILGKNYTDWSFEMFVRAALKIPSSVPVVGGMVIAGVDLGISTERIWGALEALKTKVGVTYYWGEDAVDFGTGDRAKPSYPALLLGGYDGECEDFPVAYDQETGQTLYARVGTNFEAPRAAVILEEDDLSLMDAAGIWSDGDKTGHKFNLGAYDAGNNASAVVQLSYAAASLEEAKTLAQRFTVTDAPDGTGSAFPLTVYNGSNPDSANANVSWNEETGIACFAFTVTESGRFGKDWYVSTGSVPADAVLYNVLPLPEITEVSAGTMAAGGSGKVSWTGTGLDELDSLSFFLVNSEDPAEDAGYPVGSTITADIAAGSAVLEVPAGIPGGEYLLRAVYSKDGQLNGIVHSAGRIQVENPNTPADPGMPTVAPAGDLKLGVTIPATADPNTTGYSVTVYNADGSPTEVAGMTFEKAGSGDTVLEIGGSYVSPVRADPNDRESEVIGTEVIGLAGGCSYKVGVTPYRILEGEALVYGREVVTAAVLLPAAVPPTAVLTAAGKTLTALKDLGENGTIPVFTANDLEIAARFSEAVTGTWTLDDSTILAAAEGNDGTVVSGTFTGAESATIALTGLTEGGHVLNITGHAADGDGFSYSYPFTVDTAAPQLILSSPLNGSPFNLDGTVTVSGVGDSSGMICVSIDGGAAVTFRPDTDMDGLFTQNVTIPDCDAAAEHLIHIWATDENGNATEPTEIGVIHPGLGDLAGLVLMADGVVPSDGCFSTVGGAADVQLTVLGVTSAGRTFALDQNRVLWNSYAAEGSASVSGDGVLNCVPYTYGFVEARVEVSNGASRSAALALAGDSKAGRVSVSATIGGTAVGGGDYAPGETVILRAYADEGYRFAGWEITGVTVDDLAAETLSFRMPKGAVEAKASFKSEKEQYTVTFDANGGSAVETQKVENGKTASKPADPVKTGYIFLGWTLNGEPFDFSTPVTADITLKASWTTEANAEPRPAPAQKPEGRIGYKEVPEGDDPDRYVPYTLNADGSRSVIPISSVLDGVLAYLIPEDGREVYFRESPVDFTDIRGHWAEKNVIWAAAHSLFNGVGNERFDPDGTMNRAMFVTVMYRIAGAPTVSGKCPFRDVEPGSWYENAVTWAAEQGIVKGISADQFDPKANVTREQMCAFVARFLRTFGYTPELGAKMEFKDAASISSWAAEDVALCQRMGIVGGKPGGVFDPKASATRAENATVMKRMIEAVLVSLE